MFWNKWFPSKSRKIVDEHLKKEKVLIDSNPPAYEIALANKKVQLQKQIDYCYNDFLDRINYAIETGNMEYTMTYENLKYIAPYLAVRKLRKRGFKVKTEIKESFYENQYGKYTHKYREITISWKKK